MDFDPNNPPYDMTPDEMWDNEGTDDHPDLTSPDEPDWGEQ